MNNKGETLVETLVSILIIALVITGFSIVISNTTKANKAIKEYRVTYSYNFDTEDNDHEWEISFGGVQCEDENIKHYADENGLFYYEYKKN